MPVPTGADELEGTTVAVAASAATGDGIARRLEAHGATAVLLEVIEAGPPRDPGPFERALGRAAAGEFDWVVVTSRRAVAAVAAGLAGRSLPASVRWAAVGPATAAELRRAGWRADLVGGGGGDDLAAALTASEPAPGSARRGRVLYPRAEEVHSGIVAALRQAGYEVDDPIAYRTVPVVPPADRVAAARGADVLVVTSPSAAAAALAALGGVPEGAVVVSMGAQTSAALRDLGAPPDREAPTPGPGGVVSGVVAARSSAAGPAAGGA